MDYRPFYSNLIKWFKNLKDIESIILSRKVLPLNYSTSFQSNPKHSSFLNLLASLRQQSNVNQIQLENKLIIALLFGESFTISPLSVQLIACIVFHNNLLSKFCFIGLYLVSFHFELKTDADICWHSLFSYYLYNQRVRELLNSLKSH